MRLPLFDKTRIIGDNGKENGNYCSICGLYWDNGKRKWKLIYYIGVI